MRRAALVLAYLVLLGAGVAASTAVAGEPCDVLLGCEASTSAAETGAPAPVTATVTETVVAAGATVVDDCPRLRRWARRALDRYAPGGHRYRIIRAARRKACW